MFEKTPFDAIFDFSPLQAVKPGLRAVPDVVEGSEFDDTIGIGFTDGDGDEVDGADGLDDVIDAGVGDDTIDAGDGDDTIIGGAGADTINGGDGLDFIDFSGSTSAVTVSLIGGNGSQGDAAGDTYTSIEGIIGSAFNDRFDGLSKKASVIFAGDGNDILFARGGSVEFYGEAGNDRFQIDEGRSHNNAIFDGGEGFDRFQFSGTQLGQNFRDDVFTGFEEFNSKSGTYEFNADQVVEFQRVTGNGTIDIDLNGATKIDLSGVNFTNTSASTILQGADADEEFVGSNVADTILAGSGNDMLAGGAGSDVLTGGFGDDVFVFSQATDNDIITDFGLDTDKIDISALIRDFDSVQLIATGIEKGGAELFLDYSATRKNGASSDIAIAVTQVEDDAVLNITSADPVVGTALADLNLTITLEDVDGLGLTLDDFIF